MCNHNYIFSLDEIFKNCFEKISFFSLSFHEFISKKGCAHFSLFEMQICVTLLLKRTEFEPPRVRGGYAVSGGWKGWGWTCVHMWVNDRQPPCFTMRMLFCQPALQIVQWCRPISAHPDCPLRKSAPRKKFAHLLFQPPPFQPPSPFFLPSFCVTVNNASLIAFSR